MKRFLSPAAAGVPLLAVAVLAAATAPSSALARRGDLGFVQPGLFQAAPVNIIQGFATADFNRDGHLDVASAGVFSADINTTKPRALPVQLGDGAGHLGPATLTTFSSKTGLEGPLAVAARDIDGDGVPDIATTTLDLVQATPVYRLRVLLGRGDGSFTVLEGFTLPGEVAEIVLADLTGDGEVDLAYATEAPEGETVWTAEGQGDGTFARPVAVRTTQQFGKVTGLHAVDVDGDARLDLVYGQGCVVVLLNTGDGFASAICNPLELAPYALEVTDLNEDGIPDVAFGDASGGHIRVALGDGTGHFTTAHTYSQVAGQVLSIAAIDVDGDGVRDLVASGDATRGSQTAMALLRGTGRGTFKLTSRWVSGGADIVVGDFTEDGLPDVVGHDAGGHRDAIVTVNAGGGAFQAPQLTVSTNKRAVGQLPVDVLSGDLDNDGRQDVLLVGQTLVIAYLNRGGDTLVRWSRPTSSFSSGQILSAALGDLDGDGNVDLALGGMPSDNVSVLLGSGDGGFGRPLTYNNGSGSAALSVAIGDVTGDGVADIVTNTFVSLSVLPGKGNGRFNPPILSGSAQANQSELQLLDLDDDGDLDAVGAAKTGSADNAATQVVTELNSGTGNFTNVTTTTLATNLTDATVADLTGDGRPDFAVSGQRGSHSGLSGIFVLPGAGTGLGSALVTATTTVPLNLTAADFDRDGSVDLAAATSGDTTVYRNPGNAQFPAEGTVQVLTPLNSIAVTSATYTKDTRPDIVTVQYNNPMQFILAVNSSRG